MKKPFSVYLLQILMLFQFISSIFGIYVLLIAPPDSKMRLPEEMIERIPFDSTIIPGLILLVFLCLFPAIVFIGLVAQPDWKWCEKLNLYSDKKWPWTFSVYFGIILIGWIIIQEALIGGGNFMQTAYISLGLAILIVSLLPEVMRSFSR
jgi:hypothetical protein